MNNKERVTILWQKCKRYLRNLNLFPSKPPSTDDHKLRNQRISTRLLIILLILSMAVLLLYTSLITVTKTNSVQRPNLEQYSQLYSTYSQTLTCSCSKISINYDKFIDIEYTFHQVCSSIFVTEEWFYYLATYPDKTVFYFNDFRTTATYSFQALSGFCDLINRTISDSLTRFYSNQYVSASVTPSHIFETQTQSFIDQFMSSMINSFLLFLSMTQGTTEGNSLLSGKGTNFNVHIANDSSAIVLTQKNYGNCSCDYSSACITECHIIKYPDYINLFQVPGFYIGCYVIESLLQSTLQCFYNQNCIDILLSYMPSSPGMDVRALNSSLSNKYFENSTINQVLDKLMIEQWNPLSMYDRYYNECQPIQCTYTVEARNDVIYIVTTLFGIAGGLVTILKLVVPQSVKLITYCIRKVRTRVVPEIPTVQT
jgi:hypothetical protein